MSEIYKYLYTKMSIFGSIPTYKVFINATDKKIKWIFADNSFIYGNISDWSLKHVGLDSGQSSWSKESKFILDNEKRKLIEYKAAHPEFITEVDA